MKTHEITPIILRPLVICLFLVSPVSLMAADAADEKLQAAVSDQHRSTASIARNQYRHPVETLMWFGIRDDMTVVEISPGGGWYTEVLAPYLRKNGKLIAAGYDSQSENEYFRNNAKMYLDKLASQPETYDKVKVTEFAPPKKPELAPVGIADMVLSFRNVHNWVEDGTAGQVFSAAYLALKPGGLFGLTEHRGEPHMTGKEWLEKGYMPEKEVIRLAEAAGFRLVDRSEINANPKDTKDYTRGVWTLPPTLGLGEKNKAKYMAIGESDRMTLKFIKPE